MKKSFIKLSALAFAVSALAVSCEKNNIAEGENPAAQTKHITFTASMPETRTTFGEYDGGYGEYPTLWQNGDKIHVFTNETDNSGGSFSIDDNIATVKTSDGGKTATFSLNIPASTSYYAVSPAECMEYFYKNTEYDFVIADVQTPLLNSCDPKVQIIYGWSETVDKDATNVEIMFKHHATAYGKFKFVNFDVDNDDIEKIEIKVDDNNAKLTEQYELHWSGKGEEPVYLNAWSTKPRNTITLENLAQVKGREYFWFGCAPIELDGKAMVFTIYTVDGKKYPKTISADSNSLFFEAGSVTAFALDMTGIQFE